jgi:hypothetical protein
MGTVRYLALLPILAALAIAQENVKEPRPIDFAKIERKIRKLPELHDPRYGLFLFGLNGEWPVWAVFDKSKGARTYDLLYFDLDADGDLTPEGERFQGKVLEKRRGQVQFNIGRFTDPGTKAVHTKFTITYTSTVGVRFRMLWRGEKITMGTYGPRGDTYQSFAKTIRDAPIFVPGYDRPFQFQHWMSGTLNRGTLNDFKVFIGNRGDRTGAFTCVDDKFLPKDGYVLATLVYTATDGKRKRYQVKLTSRC